MNKGCCFTGHRFIKKDEILRLESILPLEIEELVALGCKNFYAGGALGFDTLAALSVLQVKRRYPLIMLHLFLPCLDQERNWSIEQKRQFQWVLESADVVRYVSRQYCAGVMQMRNRALVDSSERCLCYLRPASKRGGTYYTVSYARKNGVEVENLFTK